MRKKKLKRRLSSHWPRCEKLRESKKRFRHKKILIELNKAQILQRKSSKPSKRSMISLRKAKNQIYDKKIRSKNSQIFSKNKKKSNSRIFKNYQINRILESRLGNKGNLRNKTKIIKKDRQRRMQVNYRNNRKVECLQPHLRVLTRIQPWQAQIAHRINLKLIRGEIP